MPDSEGRGTSCGECVEKGHSQATCTGRGASPAHEDATSRGRCSYGVLTCNERDRLCDGHREDAGRSLSIRDTTKDAKPSPCPDCGRSYTVAESVQVRVQDRPEPVWEGCIDCWVRRTSPEVCETFRPPTAPARTPSSEDSR